jgi:hypothetical protein
MNKRIIDYDIMLVRSFNLLDKLEINRNSGKIG